MMAAHTGVRGVRATAAVLRTPNGQAEPASAPAAKGPDAEIIS